MSRGHGRVQREIIAALATGEEFTLEELAAWVSPGPVTRSRMVAVARAVRGLGFLLQESVRPHRDKVLAERYGSTRPVRVVKV